MNASSPITAPHRADPLVAALTQRYLSDPKLINEVVTGSCSWPSEEGAAWLYTEAVDQLAEWQDSVANGWARPESLRLEKLTAARDALAVIANDEDEQRQAAERRFNDGPSVRLP